MKKLGQHFLRNATVLKKIVDALALGEGDRVIEIGPGHGELTVPIARAAAGMRGEICCIEKDHALIKELERLAAGESGACISILEGDALKLLPEAAAVQTEGYKIAGNIPYYITGKLLRTIGELPRRPERTVLLIQKEVAERVCAAPPAMNRLAASVQFWADAAIVAHVPRKDFFPMPDVDSAVILLKTRRGKAAGGGEERATIDPALYYRAVHDIFAQPRKTLLNNLSSSTGGTGAKNNIVDQLKKIGVDPAARGQDLSIEAIIAIAQAPLWG